MLLLFSLGIAAQDEDEYKMDIGAGAGMVSYEGDFNGSVLKDMQPVFTLSSRWIFNPRMAARLNVSYGKLKGSSADVDTYFPEFEEQPYEFDNKLVDVGLRFEYNFLPYGTGREYRGAKPLTPFVALGIGATNVSGDGYSEFTLNVPFAVGVKYKLKPRVNLGLEWAIHFSMSDLLDGKKDPYFVKSSGAFKNKDCYSALQLTLSYDIMPKCKICNKDE